MRKSKIKMSVSTTYEVRQVRTQPTPPIYLSRWMSNHVTCFERSPTDMELCNTKSGQDLNSGWLKIVIITICVSNH